MSNNIEVRNKLFLDRRDGQLIDKTTGELLDLNSKYDRERAKKLVNTELNLNQRERDLLNQLKRELQEHKTVIRPNKKGEKHMRVFSDNGKVLGYQMNYIDLSNNAMGLLFRMIYSLEYPTNRVVSVNGEPANVKELAIMSKQSPRTVQRSIKELEDKGFIKKEGETNNLSIFVNPNIVSGGNIAEDTIKLFQE